MERLGRFKATKPLFVDFTWGAGGSTAELTLELTLKAKNDFGVVPNMHLTCTNMPVEKLDNALAKCKVFCLKILQIIRVTGIVGWCKTTDRIKNRVLRRNWFMLITDTYTYIYSERRICLVFIVIFVYFLNFKPRALHFSVCFFFVHIVKGN